jgi:hypothetical protein
VIDTWQEVAGVFAGAFAVVGVLAAVAWLLGRFR